jgi:L,D-transpeptidase YcbB
VLCLCLASIAGGNRNTRFSETQVELKRILDARTLLSGPVFTRYRDDVNRFYATAQYQPAWLNGDAPTRQAIAILAELKDAGARGLRPEDYDASNWDSRVQQLRAATAGSSLAARFDLALTLCVMRYVMDLHSGRVNPGELHAGFDVEHSRYDLPGWIRERLVDSPFPGTALESLEPPFAGYHRTVGMLLIYRKLAKDDEGEKFPSIAAPIKPGERYAPAAQLAKLLVRTGDLPAGVVFESTWEGGLVDGVKRFQQRHGLEPDGVPGPATMAELNVPLSRRVRQLELTLERWRWVPHSFPRPPIVVNIPEFELRALDDQYRTELAMKVVVGGAYGHQTPVFEAEMTHLIFRPYWDVPPSILHRELLPKLRKAPAFLAKNHYEVVSPESGAIFREPTGAVLAGLESNEYRVRQKPGPDNALGGVKFIFPNPHNVYLHGTPAVELFAKYRRDFSHGCIRVEKPEDLAAWALRDMPEWTRERIRDAMNADNPRRVNLKAPVPVLIVYGTAVVSEDGEAHFYKDIYGLDTALERLLAARARTGFTSFAP